MPKGVTISSSAENCTTGENRLKEERLNLEQAMAASSSCLAYRVVGDRRVIVDRGQELLTIQIQCKAKTHWIADDDGGGVRYLAGVLRDGAGRYLYVSGDVTCIPQIRAYLPLGYQALLLPECDDWQSIDRGDTWAVRRGSR